MICPYCQKEIRNLKTRRLSAHPETVGAVDTIHVIGYACPECTKVLTVQADPVSEAAQIRILRAEFSQLEKRLDDDFRKLQSRFAAVGGALSTLSPKPENDRSDDLPPKRR